ncbi:MAG: hypothetical protein HZB13_18540 [Acidobacteria bacterium]|nr:hypothetical protein [Acidobacteriota bacterium]
MNRVQLVVAMAVAAAVRSPGQALADLRVLTTESRQYERVELGWRPERAPANPFDPNVAALDAWVEYPPGRKAAVPGFWFQGYERSLKDAKAVGKERVEVLRGTGAPEWRVRFSSGETGVHRVTLVLREAGAERRSEAAEVRIRPGKSGGFVRVSRRNPQFMEDDSGKSFFPIGENLCMYEKREGTYYFDRLLAKLAAAGGNYVRLWQEYYVPKELGTVAGPGDGSFAGFPLETQVTGLGRYDLESAWRLDYVAGLAEKLGVRWQLCFEMVVWWQQRQEHRWSRNPYNAANGGPVVKPADYLTDERARELVKRRLRYSVARWGWSTHLAAWELWNEVDNLEGFTSQANVAWHREMAQYLKQADPFGHLVTTSWRDPGMFALPEIDIVQGHSYFGSEIDAAEYTMEDSDHLMRRFGKPFFFGEQGIDGDWAADPEGKHFHDCLWASAVSGAAGSGLYWWWHNYVETNGLYRHYKALAKFVEGVDWPGRDWRAVRLSRPNLPVSLKAYGVTGRDRALVWLHDPLAFRIVEGKGVRGPAQAKASVNVVGLEDGEYAIEWRDTTTGAVVRVDLGKVDHMRHFGYGLEMRAPEFWGDVAARVLRRGAGWGLGLARGLKQADTGEEQPMGLRAEPSR